MRCSRCGSKPASAGSISTFNSATAWNRTPPGPPPFPARFLSSSWPFRSVSATESCGQTELVLQLDDDLVVGLGADVARRLDAAAADEHGGTRHHVGLQVLAVGPFAVGLGDHGDPVAAHLD